MKIQMFAGVRITTMVSIHDDGTTNANRSADPSGILRSTAELMMATAEVQQIEDIPEWNDQFVAARLGFYLINRHSCEYDLLDTCDEHSQALYDAMAAIRTTSSDFTEETEFSPTGYTEPITDIAILSTIVGDVSPQAILAVLHHYISQMNSTTLLVLGFDSLAVQTALRMTTGFKDLGSGYFVFHTAFETNWSNKVPPAETDRFVPLVDLKPIDVTSDNLPD